MNANSQLQVNGVELAEWLGLTDKRVTQLYQSGIFEKNESDLYNLKACVTAYCNYRQGRNQQPLLDEDSGLEFQNQNQRKLYFEAEAKKDEILRNRKQLLPAEEVEEVFFSLIEILRESFLILPDAFERDTGASPDQVKFLENFTRKKLTTLEHESQRLRKPLESAE